MARDAQQAADQAIILRRVTELSLNPGMNIQDGMLTTHSERMYLAPEAELLREFLGAWTISSPARRPPSASSSAPRAAACRQMIDLRHPVLLGPVQNQEHHMNGVVARRNNFNEPILGCSRRPAPSSAASPAAITASSIRIPHRRRRHRLRLPRLRRRQHRGRLRLPPRAAQRPRRLDPRQCHPPLPRGRGHRGPPRQAARHHPRAHRRRPRRRQPPRPRPPRRPRQGQRGFPPRRRPTRPRPPRSQENPRTRASSAAPTASARATSAPSTRSAPTNSPPARPPPGRPPRRRRRDLLRPRRRSSLRGDQPRHPVAPPRGRHRGAVSTPSAAGA
jgi:hypothetical protein